MRMARIGAMCKPRRRFSVVREPSLTCERFVEQGLEAALGRKPRERPAREPILAGEKEARLIQLAWSEPPAGHARWTLRRLAAELLSCARLKKRTQAVSAHRLGDSTRAKRRVRRRHGRYSGSLSASV